MIAAPEEWQVLLLSSGPAATESLTETIRAELPRVAIRTAENVGDAQRWLTDDGLQPDLVILAAGHDYAWSVDELTDLWNALPLARWMIVFDGWTRSSLRHLPWLPAGLCVPLQLFPHRLQREIRDQRRKQPPLPLTAGLEEAFLRDAEFTQAWDLRGLRVGVNTPDRDLRGWLRELITAHSGTLAFLEQNPAAVLWDLDPWQPDRIQHLEIYRRRDPDCLIVGLRNTVHEHLAAAARSHGVDVLLPKQLSGDVILEHLQALTV